jgi:transposase
MLRKFVPIGLKKGRKYPIKRDEFGRSARQQAFKLFDKGMRPAAVARLVDVKPKTAFTYFRAWKKQGGNLEGLYKVARTMMRRPGGFSPTVISILAEELGMAEEEVVERLQKPWGLKQLMMGRWPNRRLERIYSEQEARLADAFKVLYFIEHTEMSPREIMDWIVVIRERFRSHGTDY